MNDQPHRVIVKQSYAAKCSERTSENFKNVNPNILKESSRMLRSDGTVIKTMTDGTIEIYYANGLINRKELEIIVDKTAEAAQIENMELELTASKFKQG